MPFLQQLRTDRRLKYRGMQEPGSSRLRTGLNRITPLSGLDCLNQHT